MARCRVPFATVAVTFLAVVVALMSSLASQAGAQKAGRFYVEATSTPMSFLPAGAHNADWTPVVQEFGGVEMVLVPAGCFEMGSTDGDTEEGAVHRVCYEEPFWIGKYEVTNAQYQVCVTAGACSLPYNKANYDDPAYADHPVVDVTWFQASEYAAWVGGVLPSEARWDYAARGPEGWEYPWGDTFDGTRLNFCDASCEFGHRDSMYDDGFTQTAPVGSFPEGTSWVGAHDMSGNVWEWMSTAYAGYPFQADEVGEAGSPLDARALRSGSWLSGKYHTRAAYRFGAAVDFWSHGIGFRVARVAYSE